MQTLKGIANAFRQCLLLHCYTLKNHLSHIQFVQLGFPCLGYTKTKQNQTNGELKSL